MWRTAIAVKAQHGSVELRQAARHEKDGRVALRLFALANVLEGMDREAAVRQAGMTRQTLRDWVHRYSAQGLAGLRDRPKGHAPRVLTPAQERELEALVIEGPGGDLVRWRCVDQQAVIKARYGVDCHERTIGKILRRLGFKRLSVRPQHPNADPEAQAAFRCLIPGFGGAGFG